MCGGITEGSNFSRPWECKTCKCASRDTYSKVRANSNIPVFGTRDLYHNNTRGPFYRSAIRCFPSNSPDFCCFASNWTTKKLPMAPKFSVLFKCIGISSSKMVQTSELILSALKTVAKLTYIWPFCETSRWISPVLRDAYSRFMPELGIFLSNYPNKKESGLKNLKSVSFLEKAT